MRTGMIAEKIGMSRVLTPEGVHVPVTLLRVDSCQVVAVKTEETDGYVALQLGVGFKKTKNVTKPLRGHYAKAKVEPKQKLAEFRVSKDALLTPGDEISVEHFVQGQYVDVTGISIGKGFAGVMKRHNFGGGRASHGASIAHRTQGSTGMCQDPGRVFKNKKMAGHMGNEQVTKQNLTVVGTDLEEGLILIKGAVPGSKGSYVLIADAVKKQAKVELPYPAALVARTDAPVAQTEEVKVDSVSVVEAGTAEENTQS